MRRGIAWACVIVAVLPSAGVFEPLVIGALCVLGSTLVYEAWLAAIAAPVALAVARSPSAIEPIGVLVLLLELGIVFGAFIAAGAGARGIVELLTPGRPKRAIRPRGGARAALGVATALAGGLAFKAILLNGTDGDVALGALVLVVALILFAMAAPGRRGQELA
jgi:hypothetical protein